MLMTISKDKLVFDYRVGVQSDDETTIRRSGFFLFKPGQNCWQDR